MPLEVLFSPSIVLVAVDVVYVVVSHGRPRSLSFPADHLFNPPAGKSARGKTQGILYTIEPSFSTVFIWHFAACFPRPHAYAYIYCTRAPLFLLSSSVRVIMFVFVLTLHRCERKTFKRSAWKIKSA